MYLDLGRSPVGPDDDESLVCVDGVTYYNVSLAYKTTGKLGTNGPCPGFDVNNRYCNLKTGKCEALPDREIPPPGVKLPGNRKEKPQPQLKLNDIDFNKVEIAAIKNIAMDPNIRPNVKIGTIFTMMLNKARGKLIPGGAANKAAFLNMVASTRFDHPDITELVTDPKKKMPPPTKMAINNFANWVMQPATQEALYRVLVKPVSPPNFVSIENQKKEAKALISQLRAKGFINQGSKTDDSSVLKPIAYIAGFGLGLYLFYRYTRKN